MTERPARSVHGVTLEQAAILLAGRADGLPMEELFAYAGVDPKVWPRAEEAWNERILDDLEAGGTLDEELQVHMGEAQRRWSRALPPLDTDLRAWLDFERAWAHQTDADPFLSRVGMRPSDMTRLQNLWAARFREDAVLAARALSLLAGEPGAPCTPAPEPARIMTPRAATAGTGPPRPPGSAGDDAPLTLEQYAWLCVTLEVSPTQAAETLRLYRLTPEQRASLDARYAAIFASEPERKAAWEKASAGYRAYLLASRRTA